MAKTMAQLDSAGNVINMAWCSDSESETGTLRDLQGCAVAVGDTFVNGRFYHDGEMLKTPLETLTDERDRLINEMAEMIEEVYAMDSEMMEE